MKYHYWMNDEFFYIQVLNDYFVVDVHRIAFKDVHPLVEEVLKEQEETDEFWECITNHTALNIRPKDM